MLSPGFGSMKRPAEASRALVEKRTDASGLGEVMRRAGPTHFRHITSYQECIPSLYSPVAQDYTFSLGRNLKGPAVHLTLDHIPQPFHQKALTLNTSSTKGVSDPQDCPFVERSGH